MMRELGRGLVVEPLWMSAVVCANAIALAGNDAQQAALLPGSISTTSTYSPTGEVRVLVTCLIARSLPFDVAAREMVW